MSRPLRQLACQTGGCHQVAVARGPRPHTSRRLHTPIAPGRFRYSTKTASVNAAVTSRRGLSSLDSTRREKPVSAAPRIGVPLSGLSFCSTGADLTGIESVVYHSKGCEPVLYR